MKLELRPGTSSPKSWPHHELPTSLDPFFCPSFTVSSSPYFPPMWLAPGSLPSSFRHLQHSPTCSHTTHVACAIQVRVLLPNIFLTDALHDLSLVHTIIPNPLYRGPCSSKALPPRCPALLHLVTTTPSFSASSLWGSLQSSPRALHLGWSFSASPL